MDWFKRKSRRFCRLLPLKVGVSYWIVPSSSSGIRTLAASGEGPAEGSLFCRWASHNASVHRYRECNWPGSPKPLGVIRFISWNNWGCTKLICLSVKLRVNQGMPGGFSYLSCKPVHPSNHHLIYDSIIIISSYPIPSKNLSSVQNPLSLNEFLVGS